MSSRRTETQPCRKKNQKNRIQKQGKATRGLWIPGKFWSLNLSKSKIGVAWLSAGTHGGFQGKQEFPSPGVASQLPAMGDSSKPWASSWNHIYWSFPYNFSNSHFWHPVQSHRVLHPNLGKICLLFKFDLTKAEVNTTSSDKDPQWVTPIMNPSQKVPFIFWETLSQHMKNLENWKRFNKPALCSFLFFF